MELPDVDRRPASFGDQGAMRYVQAFRRQWLLILAVVVLAVGTTAALTYTAPKKYQATADVSITPVSATDPNFQGFSSVFRQPLDGSSAVVTAARVMNTPGVRHAALVSLGAHNGVSLSVTPLSQADIIAATATAPSPGLAARAANAFASAFIRSQTNAFHRELRTRISDLNRRIAAIPPAQRAGNFAYSTLQGTVATLGGYLGATNPSLSPLTSATPPGSPSSPRPMLSIAVALLAALLLGAGVAVAREFFNPRLGDEDELRLGHRLPILARIPRMRPRVVREYMTGKGQLPGSAWKGYRTLRAVLATAGPRGGYPRSILVTSAMPGDGKTMTSVNLAITLAAADLRVVLVDADLHRPMLASIFNVVGRRDGLTRLLTGTASVDEALTPAPSHPGLQLLLASDSHTHQLHLLDTRRFRWVLDRLEEEADVIVVDSPPVPEVAEALAIADAVDTVLISIRMGHTRRDKLQQLRELLARRGAEPLGFVVTTRQGAEAADAYYYEYGSDILAPAAEPKAASLQRTKAIRAVDR